MDKKIKRMSKVNNIISNDSISEKNEESSNSTNKSPQLQSKKVLKKRMMSSELPNIINNLNKPIKKSKRQTLDMEYPSKKMKNFIRKDSKKKLDLQMLKRISFQQNNAFNFNNLKGKDIFRKSESIQKNDEIHHFKRSLDYSSKNNINLSRTESFIDNKYFSSKKLKYLKA